MIKDVLCYVECHVGRLYTYFNQNTHLHVVLSAMAPPNKGPRTLEIANTEEMTAMYVGYLAGGTMRGVMTVTRE